MPRLTFPMREEENELYNTLQSTFRLKKHNIKIKDKLQEIQVSVTKQKAQKCIIQIRNVDMTKSYFTIA